MWQKNIALSKHAGGLFQNLTRAGGTWNLEVALEAAHAALQHNANVMQLYLLALQRYQEREQQLEQQQRRARITDGLSNDASMWPNRVSDPDEITKVVSKDATAHSDPGPVAFPALRPTLTGGLSLGIQHGEWRPIVPLVLLNHR